MRNIENVGKKKMKKNAIVFEKECVKEKWKTSTFGGKNVRK